MENIQVVVRVRPLNIKQQEKNQQLIWRIRNNNIDLIEQKRQFYLFKKLATNPKTSFIFDNCFNQFQSNAIIYIKSIKNIIMSRYPNLISLKGINGTIFIYGQTGSGKTYTMLGYDSKCTKIKKCKIKLQQYQDGYLEYFPFHQQTQNSGILIHSLRDLFSYVQRDMQKTYTIKCSYIEIYNDNIFDLLSSGDKIAQSLSIIQNQKKQFQVRGLVYLTVGSIEEVLQVIKKGQLSRHYAQTNMNHSSSRSHTIFRLYIHSFTNNYIRKFRKQNQQDSNINNRNIIQALLQIEQNSDKSKGTIIMESVLNFVDLAGSQNLNNHYNNHQNYQIVPTKQHSLSKSKQRVNQGKHINKSLFFLMQVISLKSEGKINNHIPFRNSPLTKILKSSLGGNSRTLIILCLTPTFSQIQQSVSTLRFGSNAKKIQNKIQANIQAHNDQIAIRMMILQYQKKLHDLQYSNVQNRQKMQSLKIQLVKMTSENLKQKDNQIENLKKQLFKNKQQKQNLKTIIKNIKKLPLQIQKDFFSPQFYKNYQQNNQLYRQDVGLLFGKRKFEHKIDKKTMDWIYDYQGKFLLYGYQLAQKQSKIYLQKWEQCISYFQLIKKDYIEMYQYAHKMKLQNRKLILQKELMQEKLLHCEKEFDKIFIELNLFKSLIGIQKLGNNKLSQLEHQYINNLQKIKEIKFIKKYQQQINKLNQYVKFPQIKFANQIKFDIYNNKETNSNKQKQIQKLRVNGQKQLKHQIQKIKESLDKISNQVKAKKQINIQQNIEFIKNFQSKLNQIIKTTAIKVQQIMNFKQMQKYKIQQINTNQLKNYKSNQQINQYGSNEYKSLSVFQKKNSQLKTLRQYDYPLTEYIQYQNKNIKVTEI